MLVHQGHDAGIVSRLYLSMLESNGRPLGKEANDFFL